jgi:SAM-dependent methyltransferase
VHAEPGSKDTGLSPAPGSKDTGLSVAAAYNGIAADYDRLVEGDAWMRRALQAHYRRVFRPGQRVLDIGCGTGLDALALAQAGVRVLGVDASAAMLERARATLSQAGLAAWVDLRVLDIADLHVLDGPLDGAISAFAALSTVGDLGSVAHALAGLIHPGGRLVVHMLNRFSSWEWLGLVWRGHWPAAARLGANPQRVFTIGGLPVVHHLYAPEAAAAHFAPAFRLRSIHGFGALRPPHTLRRIPAPLVAALECLDLRLGGLPRLRAVGRFFVLDLERRATPG